LDYFNRTLYSIGEPDHAYGLEQTRLLIHFGFDIRIQFRTSEDELQARLEAGLPTLFFLWTPHGFTNLFNLSRIDLPRYRDEEAFLKGQTGTSERASQGMLPASSTSLCVQTGLKMCWRSWSPTCSINWRRMCG
jgi:hypothetical protein